MGKFSTAAVSALLLASKVAALDPIVTKGSKFFYENGTQFFIKGIAYQEDPSGLGGENEDGKYIDPLADDAKCKRDVPILSAAGTNTIRVYAIDPKKDHSKCMTLLQDAGIYVVADLGEPNTSINRDDPHWDVAVWDRYTAVIDELAQYDNTIGFFAGNEVSNNGSNTDASAFVKAAVRDTKAYIKSKNYRWMGVGYAANDDPDIRGPSAHYFNCGPEDEAIDFWGYNIYSWCGESSMQKSGYDKQVEFFSNYSVPVFLAEYGCNVPDGAEGRLFQDTTALYSDDMSGVFSGGIVYMYHQEDNDYGLVKFKGNSKAEVMKNYKVLSSRPCCLPRPGRELAG
ncbi:1 like protein [Verticillium longisporum]|nr:1 like protein [Verticillium longisporum]